MRILNWAAIFRENHNMWFWIQDTTISYLIARNPRLKKTNSFWSTNESCEQFLLLPSTWRVACRVWLFFLSLFLSLPYHLYHLVLGEQSAQLGHVIVIDIVFLLQLCLPLSLCLSLSLSLPHHLYHLVLGEQSTQLGHIRWAEFPFKLVQRWPVLLASLTIRCDNKGDVM